MNELTDFRIYQRDADGYARVPASGTLTTAIPDGWYVGIRVLREDENLTVIPWIPCETDGTVWSVELTVPEGGLYRIEVALCPPDNGWVTLVQIAEHIGVGDIYVTAGQSNMTGYGRDNAYDPPTLGVHCFANTGRWKIAAQPLGNGVDSVFGYPELATGTSPALSFARRLYQRLGIPVGIVPAAVGGTPLSLWHPGEDGGCYREMAKRLALIGSFRGYLWCQGCSDAHPDSAPTYYDRFVRMKELWDEAFGRHPMLTVQLNRWCGTRDLSVDRCWGMIRDAQRRAALDTDGVYVVPALDLPLTDGIHNSSGANVIIGERLANAALAELYDRPGQTAALVTGARRIDDTHVFVNITDGHRVGAMDDLAFGMNVEDADGLIEGTRATSAPGGMILETERPYTMPARFHYAWRSRPPLFPARDSSAMPLVACYGIDLSEE